jgi:hypothetical protein
MISQYNYVWNHKIIKKKLNFQVPTKNVSKKKTAPKFWRKLRNPANFRLKRSEKQKLFEFKKITF